MRAGAEDELVALVGGAQVAGVEAPGRGQLLAVPHHDPYGARRVDAQPYAADDVAPEVGHLDARRGLRHGHGGHRAGHPHRGSGVGLHQDLQSRDHQGGGNLHGRGLDGLAHHQVGARAAEVAQRPVRARGEHAADPVVVPHEHLGAGGGPVAVAARAAAGDVTRVPAGREPQLQLVLARFEQFRELKQPVARPVAVVGPAGGQLLLAQPYAVEQRPVDAQRGGGQPRAPARGPPRERPAQTHRRPWIARQPRRVPLSPQARGERPGRVPLHTPRVRHERFQRLGRHVHEM